MSAYNPAFDQSVGTLRALGINAPYSNNGNGVVLGSLEKSVNGTSYYMSVDTQKANCGPIVNIPKGNGQLTLFFADLTETSLLTDTIPHFDVILTFRVLHDDTFHRNSDLVG